MSFTFGGVDVGVFTRLEAIRRVTPKFSGVSIEASSVTGRENRNFHGVTRPTTRIEYELVLNVPQASGENVVKTMLLSLGRLLDPSYGPRQLILNDDPDWCWNAVVAEEVAWEQAIGPSPYGGNVPWVFTSEVIFESVDDAAAREVDPTVVSVDGATTIHYEGNTRILPRVEIQGTISSAQTLRLVMEAWPTSGGRTFSVDVRGPLAAGQTMVLDWDTMDFGIWEGNTKVASVVRRMSTYERPQRHAAEGSFRVRTGWASGAGTLTSVKITPRFRKA